MLNVIWQTLSHHVSLNIEEDQDNDKEDAELGKVSKDDKTTWLTGTISKIVEQPGEAIQQ